jgi:arylsulfatase A-like enzyme
MRWLVSTASLLSLHFLVFLFDYWNLFTEQQYVFFHVVLRVGLTEGFWLALAALPTGLFCGCFIPKTFNPVKYFFHVFLAATTFYLLLNSLLELCFASIWFGSQLIGLCAAGAASSLLLLVSQTTAQPSVQNESKKVTSGLAKWDQLILVLFLIPVPLAWSHLLPRWQELLSLGFYLLWLVIFIFQVLLTRTATRSRITQSLPMALILLLSLLLIGMNRADMASGKPNLILVVIDTFRVDSPGCYGNPAGLTPTLDRLASEGVLYEQAYAPSSWTIPSHGTLFTGIPPTDHGAVFQVVDGKTSVGRLNPELPTLAQILSKNGYETACFSGNQAISTASGLVHGFDKAATAGRLAGNPARDIHSCEPWGWLLRKYFGGMKNFSAAGQALTSFEDKDAAITTAIQDWRTWHTQPDKPFFLFINLFSPHHPYNPPVEWREKFVPPGTPLPPIESQALLELLVSYALNRENPPSVDWQTLNRLYDSEVAYADQILGTIFESLQQEGALKNAQIIVCGDHGEGFGEPPHSIVMHCHWLDTVLTHVPLVVWDSGQQHKGERTHNLVDLEDVFYQLLKVAGIDPGDSGESVPLFPPTEQGRKIQVSVAGGILPDLFANSLGEQLEGLRETSAMRYVCSCRYSLRNDRGLLIHTLDTDQKEFYSFDPVSGKEQILEASAEMELKNQLLEQLSEWRNHHPMQTSDNGVLSPRMEKTLRALGYL